MTRIATIATALITAAATALITAEYIDTRHTNQTKQETRRWKHHVHRTPTRARR